ncbi:TIGR04222 domain-containing membrane protein [Streptomyces altiplanensis]
MTLALPALLITLAVIAASLTLTLGVQALRRSPGGPAHVHDLMEVAFLNGGPARTVDTALATMHSDGRLAIGGPGIASARSTLARDPVERTVFAELAAAPNGALHTLRHAVMRSATVQEIGDSLAFRGLMVEPWAARKWRSGSIVLLVACALGVPVALVVTMVVSVLEESFAPFVLLVLPALVLGIVCGAVNASRAGARVTPAGRAAVRAYRAAHADRYDVGHLVALNGLRALPDRVLWEQLRTAARLTPGIPRASSRRPSPANGDNSTAYATVAVVWCAGSSSGASSCGSSSGGSGSGHDSGSGGSGGSSCGSGGGSSCGSSGGSSCGGGGGGGSSCGGGGGS